MQTVISNKQAIVLCSGGLDSATVLAAACEGSYQCYVLSFDYGQRHLVELDAAQRLVASYPAILSHKVVKLSLPDSGGSALTNPDLEVPVAAMEGIPPTYVPARNTLFLSYALAWAETLRVYDIFIGVNAVDYSGYPDCRPDYIAAYETLANLATRIGTEQGQRLKIHTPLLDLSKAEIIKKGVELGCDYALTISCYQADSKGRACGKCDSCRFRRQGFMDAGVPDPTLYIMD